MPCSARVASFARLMPQCELTTPRRRRPDCERQKSPGTLATARTRCTARSVLNLPCLQSEHGRRGNSEPILRRHPRCRRTISHAGARSRSFHGKRAPVSLAANCNILGQNVTPRPRFDRLRVSFRRLRSARPQRRLPPGGLPPSAFAPITPSQRRAGRRSKPNAWPCPIRPCSSRRRRGHYGTPEGQRPAAVEL